MPISLHGYEDYTCSYSGITLMFSCTPDTALGHTVTALGLL